jgi:hypothetical protein
MVGGSNHVWEPTITQHQANYQLLVSQQSEVSASQSTRTTAALAPMGGAPVATADKGADHIKLVSRRRRSHWS